MSGYNSLLTTLTTQPLLVLRSKRGSGVRVPSLRAFVAYERVKPTCWDFSNRCGQSRVSTVQ